MSKTKQYIAIGALLYSGFSGLALPIADTFADSPDYHWMANTGFNDVNLFRCVLNAYEAANNVDDDWLTENLGPDDALPAAGLANIKTIECASQGVTSAVGLNKLPNLETLNLFGNTELWSIDVSGNTKLKEINISNNPTTYYDFSNNPELETISTDRSLYLKTIAYAKKITEEIPESAGGRIKYMIDMDDLKFLDQSSTHGVGFPDQNSVSETVSVIAGGYTHQVSTRPSWVNYAVYLNGDAGADSHNPISLNNNCTEATEGYYTCNNKVFAGDIVDTDEIINNTLSKIFNLSNYHLSKVEIKPSTAKVQLSVDTDLSKKGVILPDETFTLGFHFDYNAPAENNETTNDSQTKSSGGIKTPDTGAFTGDRQAATAITTTMGAAIVSAIAYISGYIIKRQKSKVRFDKK